ncbi:uncharacterized protein zgc:194930 [Clinocottus analis]|uniref:uncharacterized protein zgc:194930 n=1 Tax=Clinocottus analis TaxID=304258 RepID=UPI0035BF2061
MGCQCCRMIKSYIYEPSEAADVRKSDSAVSSLYQPHHLPGGDPLGGLGKQKQGFSNLGYSRSNDSTLKLEVDNNHVNQRMHAAPPPPLAKERDRQGGAPLADGALYIIQPEAMAPRWLMQDKRPSLVPVYPETQQYENQRSYGERGGGGGTPNEWDRRTINECGIGGGSLSADEIDEGVGGTPEYPCDTGDEGSVLSVEIHTSTTSLSSADTRDERRLPKAPFSRAGSGGVSVPKSEGGAARKGEEGEEAQSVTESMVAEALAALEAATAGEDSE